MTHQKRTRFMVAATLLGMILLGFAQGSGASELVGATEGGSDVVEVMEEIVTTGRKKDHCPISRDGTIELFRISFGRRQP